MFCQSFIRTSHTHTHITIRINKDRYVPKRELNILLMNTYNCANRVWLIILISRWKKKKCLIPSTVTNPFIFLTFFLKATNFNSLEWRKFTNKIYPKIKKHLVDDKKDVLPIQMASHCAFRMAHAHIKKRSNDICFVICFCYRFCFVKMSYKNYYNNKKRPHNIL